jgi:hypothetical protein
MAKTTKLVTDIKYTDKSIGQLELIPIFETIKTLISQYNGKGTLKSTSDNKAGQYNVMSFKKIEISGRQLEGMYFASCLIQKGFVGFYYFPIYACPEAKAPIIQQELLKLLKGKTCFHIKKNDPLIIAQIAQALKDGYEMYQRMGWV